MLRAIKNISGNISVLGILHVVLKLTNSLLPSKRVQSPPPSLSLFSSSSLSFSFPNMQALSSLVFQSKRFCLCMKGSNDTSHVAAFISLSVVQSACGTMDRPMGSYSTPDASLDGRLKATLKTETKRVQWTDFKKKS